MRLQIPIISAHGNSECGALTFALNRARGLAQPLDQVEQGEWRDVVRVERSRRRERP
jgi:hypothetical protein